MGNVEITTSVSPAPEATIVDTPVQKSLFCDECGGWGTRQIKNPWGALVTTSCPRGCPEIAIPATDLSDDPVVVAK